MSYTKGPWTWTSSGCTLLSAHKGGDNVVLSIDLPEFVSEGDKAIIATAPELLEEAKESLALIERIIEGKDWGAIEEIADGLRNVITKAQGEGL